LIKKIKIVPQGIKTQVIVELIKDKQSRYKDYTDNYQSGINFYNLQRKTKISKSIFEKYTLID